MVCSSLFFSINCQIWSKIANEVCLLSSWWYLLVFRWIFFHFFYLLVHSFIHIICYKYLLGGKRKENNFNYTQTMNLLLSLLLSYKSIAEHSGCWRLMFCCLFFFALSAWPHTHLLSSFSLLWLVLVYSKKMLIMNMNKRNGGKNHDYFGGPLLYFKYKPVFCFFSYLFF